MAEARKSPSQSSLRSDNGFTGTSTPTRLCSADIDLFSQNSIECSMVIGSSLDAENVANFLHAQITQNIFMFYGQYDQLLYLALL